MVNIQIDRLEVVVQVPKTEIKLTTPRVGDSSVLEPKVAAVGGWPPHDSHCPDLCDSGIMVLLLAHTARIFILYICSP